MRITWHDLAVELNGQSSDDLLAEWRWLVPSSMSIRMVSALGDAFLEDEAGRIYWLDVGSADVKCIAESQIDFDGHRQEPANAEEWFIPLLVGDLLTSGRTLARGQCFSYKIPLTLGGTLDIDNFDPCDISVHFGTLGQIQQQVKDLPIGTPISSIKLA